jgi:hypothetical protein
MLAITGMLFAEVWHPMLYAPSNVPAIFAFQGTLQQSSILAPVLLAIGAVETASFPGWECAPSVPRTRAAMACCGTVP